MQAPADQAPPNRVAWTLELLPVVGQEGAVLVDVGAGSGSLMSRAEELGYRVSGVDFDPPLVAWLRSHKYRVECVDASSEPLPYPDGSVDVVTFCDVIEHLVDPFYAASEILRILKPAGYCLAGTANYSHWKLVLDLAAGSHRPTSDDKTLLDGGHVSYWGAEDLAQFMTAVGFVSVAVYYLNVHKCPDDVAKFLMKFSRSRAWIDNCYQIAVGRKP
jgi:2-polyprenyl-3-methyl-5-hydroxy-6-metoxy-1,4-benzoquinol methylase